MSDYRLLPHENFIQETSRVHYRNEKPMRGYLLDTLILTSENLVFVNKKVGLFRSDTKVDLIPLQDIKVHNGKAQAIATGELLGPHHLKIASRTGEVDLSFTSGKECKQWAQKINEQVTGDPSTITSGVGGGAAYLLKETVGSFAGAFGRPRGAPATTQVAATCSGCTAPITGAAGTIATCDYCDSPNELR